ncbi:NHLP leader peptide family natural product precursor [Nostoc sp. UCD121]|uniref:NHLP leader peptide family RiPP precursor n=1 Tax=unclassified Nostoc TaxID=2593658 RepID=UPI001624460C|nr:MULTISPECIES: NHLP leader peptide family RiPP precursor [unclassified Nostoc]MBC1223658.1 NHLP leader peptide family natural product precursor [Nostoc sp. UCD120]MBC1279595.1 NHLP leader peptide family natural product precursor [Nostoc sp. UCD121]MBC1296625.1 NHLP leader peptide family natural product precursor [Nostoc sp. UCD122]
MKSQIKSYEALLEHLWADEQLKNNFIANPKATFAEMGVHVSNSITIEVHEDSLELKNLVLPLKSESQIGNVTESAPGFQAIIQQAWKDESFKSQLLQNPKAAIKKMTGTDLSDTLIICVYEDTLTVKHLVIPVNTANEELSELDLIMVAGGIGRTAGIIVAQ